MRRLFIIAAFLLTLLTGALPVEAQVSADDILRLGIQVLNGANGIGPQPAPPTRQRVRPAVTAQPRPSTQSATVAEVQRALNVLGYPAGAVDGQAGPRTRQAIADFQRAHGLAPTGAIDPALIGTLRAALTGRSGPAEPQTDLADAPPSGTFSLLEGFDLPNGDYRSGMDDASLRNIGPEGCRQVCAADGRCRGFTYDMKNRICFLKEAVGGRARYAGAVSGIKGADAAAPASAAPVLAGGDAGSDYAAFVHLALMSDAEAYLEDAARTGAAYVQATGTEEDCRAFYTVAHSDEFTRRDYLDGLAALARDVIAELPTRPRRLEIPVEATYDLADYDFERERFPFASYQRARIDLRSAGTVPLLTTERPSSCRVGFHLDLGSGRGAVDFMGLQAEHRGVPGVDFIPMSRTEARAFRVSGEGKVVLRARLSVEPRDQGRGPLKGRVVSLSAHHPATGALLHSWNVEGAETPAEREADRTPWAGDLLAALIGPSLEPRLDPHAFDAAAARYFSYHAHEIAAGNPPPGSPLPIEEMRGRQAEVIAARNRGRLRAILLEARPALPLAVFMEQTLSPYFAEERGIYFNAIENDGGASGDLESLTLSGRDLPLYFQLPFLRPWSNDVLRKSFREAVVADQGVRIGLELDRIARLEPVAMIIEQAAARGLVGYAGAGLRDSVVVRWELDIAEVRAEGDAIVLSAALRGLSYRWASDGAPIADVDVAAFPTVAGLREAAEAALPPLATAMDVATPAAGAPFGTEMADLLRLRDLPETVDDGLIERMMITRFAYEARASHGGAPLWGHFFRTFEDWPTPDERAARLDEFRAWSEARAAALPQVLTLTLPLDDTPEGKKAPFEYRGRHPYADSCASAADKQGDAPSEGTVAAAKICAVIDAAWQSPEPFVPLDERGIVCADDAYCATKRNANIDLKLPFDNPNDWVRLDRVPVLDAAVRSMKDRALMLEIDVEPRSVAVEATRPESNWRAALRKVQAFGVPYGAGIVYRLPDERAPERPILVYDGRAIAARVVDRETRAVVATVPLSAPAALPFELLTMPESKVGRLDVLGIRLGMTFGEADRLIREHMDVGKVLIADRKRQPGSVSGNLRPYTSGRLYASADGTELIAIHDEPPAAPETVLGVWRLLRLPAGSADQAGLKAILTERYGEPGSVEEVSLPFMRQGLAFLWFDHRHERCQSIGSSFQDGLWQDEAGNASWLPSPMIRAEFPMLGGDIFLDVRNEPLPESSFCPQFLGVRFASYDGRNAGEHAGDEILTWLSDNRTYFKRFYESRSAPAAPSAAAGEAAPRVKF